MILLETRGLSKSFGGLRAVDGVDFAVTAGSITGIIGPNGAGKTTMFNLISRALPATSGSIVFDGADVTSLQAHQVARRGLARTFQSTTLFADASAVENVLVGYRQRTRAGLWDAMVRSARLAREEREANEAARAALDSVGLSGFEERLPSELSGGQQQRVAVARALVSRPSVMFADEPTGNLDSSTSAEILGLLRDSVDGLGQTTVMVTHDAHAAAIADRVLFLADGDIVRDLGPSSAHEILATLEQVSSR